MIIGQSKGIKPFAKIVHNGWQYGKWLITGYKLVELHYCLSEVECLNNHRTSHLPYCVLWAAVLFKI